MHKENQLGIWEKVKSPRLAGRQVAAAEWGENDEYMELQGSCRVHWRECPGIRDKHCMIVPGCVRDTSWIEEFVWKCESCARM